MNNNSLMQTIRKDLADLRNLDPQRRAFVFALIFVLFIVSILVGAYLSRGALTQQAQQSVPEVTRPLKQSTNLAISPSRATLKVGQTQTMTVNLSQFAITVADIYIKYDPTVFAVSNIQNGTVFSNVNEKKADTGVISFRASVSPENPNDLKEGEVFTFTVKALKEAPSSTLVFDNQNTIAALNGDNFLGLTTGATITVMR